MAGNKNPHLAQLSALVPLSLRHRIDRIARDNSLTIGYVIRQALEAGIDEVDDRYPKIIRRGAFGETMREE